MALSADFLANDKPLYMVYKGQTYFPVPYSYLVNLGLTQWPLELLNVDYRSLAVERAIFPPIPYRPNQIDLTNPFAPPSAEHWLGTDRLGRDVMAGIVHGSRYSLSIGFVSVGIALVIGVLLGALAGFFGGWVDLVISRLFELMLAIPTFLLLHHHCRVPEAKHLLHDDHHWTHGVGRDGSLHQERIFKGAESGLCHGGHSDWPARPPHHVSAYLAQCAGSSARVGGAGHRLGHSCWSPASAFWASASPPTPSPGDRSSTKPAVTPSPGGWPSSRAPLFSWRSFPITWLAKVYVTLLTHG